MFYNVAFTAYLPLKPTHTFIFNKIYYKYHYLKPLYNGYDSATSCDSFELRSLN